MNQEVSLGGHPGASIGGQPTARNQVVDVGMVAPFARPGLQDADHAELAAHEARVLGQLLERGRRGAEEQVVDQRLVLERHRAQRTRQGERDQEVRHRQQELLLAGQPVLGRIVLAGRTVAITTGVVGVAGGVAGGTAVDLPAQGRRSAGFDGVHRRELLRRQLAAPARAIVRSIASEDVAEGDHVRPAVNVSNAVVACCSVLRVRWV